uniref:Exported protein n=1 Tax=Strongyloides venezuelensis TaxID=75913 RepID=A0A0K0F2P4_STRVS
MILLIQSILFFNEDICVSYILNTNINIYSITIRNNSQADNLVKAIENKKDCAKENILSERCIDYLRSTNYPIDGKDYLTVTNIVRETILFNHKITFSTASCYLFTRRGKKVKRDKIAFGFVSLSQALNR